MEQQEFIDEECVNARTRAGKNGREIICPECATGRIVYHFSWSGLWCLDCGGFIKKNDFIVKKKLIFKKKV